MTPTEGMHHEETAKVLPDTLKRSHTTRPHDSSLSRDAPISRTILPASIIVSTFLPSSTRQHRILTFLATIHDVPPISEAGNLGPRRHRTFKCIVRQLDRSRGTHAWPCIRAIQRKMRGCCTCYYYAAHAWRSMPIVLSTLVSRLRGDNTCMGMSHRWHL